MSACETVKVKRGDSVCIVNKSDLRESDKVINDSEKVVKEQPVKSSKKTSKKKTAKKTK